MISELENAIVARLEPLKEELGIRVMAFPDNADSVGRAMPKGQVLVGFKSENLQPPPPSSSSVVQGWNLEFEISLQLKDLRNHAGAYPVMEKIRDLLSGYRPVPANNRFFYQTKADFVSLNEGIWFYAMTFAIELQYVKKIWRV